jgi:hypothetical protein
VAHTTLHYIYVLWPKFYERTKSALKSFGKVIFSEKMRFYSSEHNKTLVFAVGDTDSLSSSEI